MYLSLYKRIILCSIMLVAISLPLNAKNIVQQHVVSLYKQAEFTQLISLTDSLLANSINTNDIYYYRALSYMQLKQYNDACNNFSHIPYQHSLYNNAYIEYARCMVELKKYNTALLLLDSISTRKNIDTKNAMQIRAIALHGLHRYTDAEVVYDSILLIDSMNSIALYNKLDIALQQQQYSKVSMLLQVAEQRIPQSNEYTYYKAAYHMALKDYETAMPILNQLWINKPNDARISLGYARCLFEARSFSKALDVLNNIDSSDILYNSYEFLRIQSRCYFEQNQNNEALQAYNLLLAKDSTQAGVWLERAKVHEQLKNFSAAYYDAQKSNSLLPNAQVEEYSKILKKNSFINKQLIYIAGIIIFTIGAILIALLYFVRKKK